MGMGPVGYSSDEEDNPEPTDLEKRSRIAKPSKGKPQTTLHNSGVDKGSGAYGSAGLLEAIEFRRTQLEVPAACASQGTIESLQIGLLPEQVASFLMRQHQRLRSKMLPELRLKDLDVPHYHRGDQAPQLRKGCLASRIT